MDALSAALKVAASGLDRPVGAAARRFGEPRQRPVDRPYAWQRSLSAARPSASPPSSIARTAGRSSKSAAIGRDAPHFPIEYQPGNEAANEAGYVKMPNVNVLIEMADMREANRSYEANLQVIKQARELITMTIDLMRNQ